MKRKLLTLEEKREANRLRQQRFRENARQRMIREHQEKNRIQQLEDGDQDALRKVVPIRFDSAPTRVRFDSAPTKVRLDSPADSRLSKCAQEPTPKTAPATKQTLDVPTKDVVRPADSVVQANEDPIAENDSRDKEDSATKSGLEPVSEDELSNSSRIETDKKESDVGLSSDTSVTENEAVIVAEKVEEKTSDVVDAPPSIDAPTQKDESQNERDEKISNPSSSDSEPSNDVEMKDVSAEQNDLPVLEKCAIDEQEKSEPSTVELSEEPPKISKVTDKEGDVDEKKSSNEEKTTSSEDGEKELAEGEAMEVDGKESNAAAVEDDKDCEVSFCSISDVRTVTETIEEDSQANDNDSEEKKEKADDTTNAKSTGDEKADNEKGAETSGKKKDASESPEAEIKTYATDTMNELLGLFGYDKMDDSTKDKLQLKGTGDTDKKATGDELVVINDSEADAKEKDETDTEKKTKEVVERLCAQCDKTKGCKYQVLVHGGRQYICDEECFKLFKSKQKPASTTPTPASQESRPQTRSVTTPKDYCCICRREIKNGMGFLPSSGESKPVCSEECMRKYQALHAPKRACAQCGNAILGRNKCLTWETMEFCNEDCLGKYQSYLGSHCACCNNAVQRTSLGKYCVRFGSDIKQFCSNNCLEEFKKGLKVCSFCQKDISSGTEGFLAPVGEKGQFKDFCSQRCMEKYETMNSTAKVQPTVNQCSVCNKTTAIKVQVTFEGKSHKLCSEPCIAAFRYANKIDTSLCDTCEEFFSVDDSDRHSIQFEGTSKRFCTKTCMNVFVLSHRKIVPCTWCKVKKYNFDMIERVDSNNHVQLFCSLNCLSLFRVSLNATSSRSIRCDFCTHSRPAQYHLTMSDASIRNFCSYQCVMNFQSQFTNVAPVTPSSPVQPPTTAATNSQTNNGTPVISSVMSLAPTQPAKPTATTKPAAASIPSPSIVTTASTTTSTTTTTSSPAPPQVTQQIIIKPPPPKIVKNKSILCKPFLQTKGVSCKPHPCHKGTQKDNDNDNNEELPKKPIVIPVPVPIYVPVPMHMYVNPAPIPIMFPIPIPVPIFIPTTKNSADEILQHIKEIKNKIPENPFEAELLMMAEMVAVNNGSKNKKPQNGSSEETNPPSDHASADEEEHSRQDSVDTQLQEQVNTTNAFSDDMLQMALRMATEMDEPAMDLEDVLATGKSQQQESDYNAEDGDSLTPRELRARTRSQKRVGGSGRGRGRKRARVESSGSPQPTPGAGSIPENTGVLKFTYGVNAWKHWVLQKNTQLEKASQSNRKLKLFKTDLLQLTADELNYSLCLFVKEVRKPNGEEYAADSIFYLSLGIQQYLFDNGRIDNIFTDAYYEKFTECLNEVLQRYDSVVTPDAFTLSRIEEEILWESKQLGAHSPHVLLNTLMYFNTKYFLLKTVEDHMKLSFSHVMKHWRKPAGAGTRGNSNANNTSRNVLLRYCPPPGQKPPEVGRKRKEEQATFEQLENLDNPLRCPVKLYEFYLSKCPESIKNRSDVFYLYPERSCVPDSPVWYSMSPLGREAVSKMLQRIKMVREVYDPVVTS